MNNELQKQLAELLASLTSAAGEATKFAGDQIPPLVQEKIVYGRVVTTVAIVVTMGVGLWCVRLFLTGWALSHSSVRARYDGWIEANGSGQCMVSGAIGAVCVVLLMVAGNDAAMVWFAPRLYIVEWLRGML